MGGSGVWEVPTCYGVCLVGVSKTHDFMTA